MQGEFTKEEAEIAEQAIVEMHKGLSKRKQMDFLGHLNDALLFINAAKNKAPK